MAFFVQQYGIIFPESFTPLRQVFRSVEDRKVVFENVSEKRLDLNQPILKMDTVFVNDLVKFRRVILLRDNHLWEQPIVKLVEEGNTPQVIERAKTEKEVRRVDGPFRDMDGVVSTSSQIVWISAFVFVALLSVIGSVVLFVEFQLNNAEKIALIATSVALILSYAEAVRFQLTTPKTIRPKLLYAKEDKRSEEEPVS